MTRANIQGLRQSWGSLPGNTRGVLWALAGSGCMATMATMVKFLGQELSNFEVSFFRAAFGLIVILPFVAHGGMGAVRTNRLRFHLARGAIGGSAMLTGFYALTILPLALATSLSFARPLFMIVLAVLFLGEVVRMRRWTATVVGFVGVIVMLRPTGAIEPAAFLSLLSAFLVACAMVLTKIKSTTERPVTMILYATMFGTVITLIPAIVVWQTPTLGQFALLGLMGIVGTLASNCMIRALAAGEATLVTPVEYVRILFAGLFGYFLFTETPDLWMGEGAVIVIGSTLYITLREARLGSLKPQAAPDA